MSEKMKPFVWPRPRKMRLTGGRLALGRPMRVALKGAAPWLREEAEKAVESLNRAAGRKVAARVASGRLRLIFADRSPVRKPEGYSLIISRGGVRLAANDARGMFYGAQTLLQLLDASRTLPCVEVRDWPRHGVRGIHMYLPARENFGFFTRFLDYMARCKLNTLFLEIGGGMEYKRHPEINAAWEKFCRALEHYDPATDPVPSTVVARPSGDILRGPVAMQNSRYFRKDSTHTELAGGTWLTQAEMRRLRAECIRRHIEIVPEVQSLSHSYYLCMAHPEIAERPLSQDPWPDTYCPSNPKSYELYFDVLDEVIEMFHPRMVHIGHDEAYTFRVCPKCRRRSGHDIFAGDVLKVHDYLAARGIRTIMWGDKFMVITTPDGRRYGGVSRWQRDPRTGKMYVQPPTWKSARRMPKDLMILDWYWSLDPNSAKQFHKHGFEVIYGNIEPSRFENWPGRSAYPYLRGAEVSTWSEVSGYAFAHNGVFPESFATAQMLWDGDALDPKGLSPAMEARLAREVEHAAGLGRWLVRGGAGKLKSLDLSGAAGPLPASLRGKIKTGRRVETVLGHAFDVAASKTGALQEAVVLSKDGARAATVEVGSKADRIVLVHGTTMRRVRHHPTYNFVAPSRLLECTVVYADRKRAKFAADYGDDIGHISGKLFRITLESHFRAVPVHAGRHTFYAQEWSNPRPNAPIARLQFRLGTDATPTGEMILIAAAIVR